MDNKRKFYESRTKELIKSLTNFQEDEENFSKCLDFALDSFIYHQYLDVDPFKVRKRISGFSEKFQVQSEDEKSRKLNDLASKYYDILIKGDAHTRETGYSVLALLMHLSGSCELSENIIQDENENCQENSDEVNWTEYLREPEPSTTTSDCSSIWSESDEDSLESNAYSPDVVPPSSDSGIEVNPETNVPYVPPCAPFQPFKEPGAKKKRIPYWEPRYRTTNLEATSKNINTNFTKVWEEQLAENCPIYTPNTNVVLTEAIVVRETLWMLHGLKNLYVYPLVDGRYRILSHMHMKHISENTLKEVLSTLCHYGEKVCAIMEFINQVLPIHGDVVGHCYTYQAYGRGLLFFIDHYRTTLTSYEKLIIDKKLVTLIQLAQKLKPQFDELELLFDIHTKVMEQLPQDDHSWKHSLCLLEALWKQLVDYSIWTRNKSTLRILLFLFFTCLRPFMKILENAVTKGQFNDDNGEFFIQRNEEVGILDEKFWSRALSFREMSEEQQSQYFLKPLFSDILLASKSMEMLHHLHHRCDFHPSSDSIPDFLFTQFVEDFRNLYIHYNCKNNQVGDKELRPSSYVSCGADEPNAFSCGAMNKMLCDELSYHHKQIEKIKDKCVDVNKHWRLCQRVVDAIQPSSTILFHSLIERSLVPCIRNACHFTNKELIRFLKEKHDLVFHLSVMQKYFLMIEGDVMFAFYSEVFDRMLDHDFKVDLTFINNALSEAVSCVDCETSQKLILTLIEASNAKKNRPLQQLATLNLSYDVGWPINVILNKEAQQKYCQIFGFLLQIKCAKYYLDGLYCCPLVKEDVEHPSKIERWLSKDEPSTQKIHGMYIIRMRMLHFINGFHNYIMSRSLHSSGIELNENLEKAENLEDIISNHQRYLSSLLLHCLFDSKLPYLREQILKMLSLALQFQSFWLAGVDEISMDDLKIVESEFSSCINLLKSYLSKPLIRGKSAHLEDLANVIITESNIQHIFL